MPTNTPAGVNFLNAVVRAVGDIKVPAGVDADATRKFQLAVAATFRTELRHVASPAVAELLNKAIVQLSHDIGCHPKTPARSGSLNSPAPVPGRPVRQLVVHTSTFSSPLLTPHPNALMNVPFSLNSSTR